ncbi:MAG: caspase family protein, partial [Bryobacteraceae bacterium]|nr:caspase family protein [Bryobacteraceae bacterium]
MIGISSYNAGQLVTPLEGPKHDVAALKAILVKDWEFSQDSITTLQDGAATRANIMAALERLAKSARAGDYVFVYYSGHGTSAYDPHLAQRLGLGLQPYTGALVPADVRAGSVDEVSERLVIGKRDLQPVFFRMSAVAEVFVVFDTCYSGMTARGG